MYIPAHFAADDADALIARLARRWAGVLVTVDAEATPVGTHLPVLWDVERKIATGHIARANPQWKQGDGRGLIVLSGAEAYVTPAWYPSKAEHGKTVPTWNYEVVHAHGVMTVHDDERFVRGVLAQLTRRHEAAEPRPWKMGDSAPEFIDGLLQHIVGIEIAITSLVGKVKLSQNKDARDREGVADRLAALGKVQMAALMRSAD